MATFDWTSLNDGDVLAPFDPDADILNFDDAGISAAALLIDTSGSDLVISFEGKTVTVQMAPHSATSTNVTFADGSVLLIGDDTSGTASDNAANILIGGNFNDQLIGLGGADTLDAGDGDDLVNGGLGNDNLDGGVGVDFADFRDAGGSVTVNLTTEVSSGASGADELANFEGILGSEFNDTLTGANLVDNALYGMGGDDLLRQKTGADTLDGGEGTDRLGFNTGVAYGAGVGVTVDLASGASDADNSSVANAVATLVSIETVIGTVGDDSFFGGDVTHEPDTLGHGVTETFQPGGGNDAVTGATGNGVKTRVDYAAFSSAMTIDLGAGTSTGSEIGTDSLVRVDQVFAGNGNDSLNGGSQERSGAGGFFESFRGNAGNDTIDGVGTDTVVGSAGSDAANYANSTLAVIANLGTASIVVGLDTVLGGTARDGFGFTDTLLNIDQIEGSANNDTLVGGAGNHRLIGGAGNDYLAGAAAGVEASYETALSAVTASLASGTASDGQGGSDVLVGITDLRGGDFDDTLTGDANANRIIGDPGDDTINGGDGIDFANYSSTPLANGGINAFIENGSGSVGDGFGTTDTLSNIEGLIGTHSDDTLAGGAGDQWFVGRGGGDNIDGGADSDWVSYVNDPADVAVDLDAGTATDGWGGIWALGGTDTLAGIENVEGSAFDDTITGNTDANQVLGRDGADSLDGGDGHDTLMGGGGNDTLLGGLGDDVLDPNSNDGSANTESIDGGDGIDTLDRSTVTGNQSIDLLAGTNGSSRVVSNVENAIGGSGSDTITGSAGVNELLGGAGSDLLRQTTGADTLDGGEGTEDRIDFTQTGITYGGAVGVVVDLSTGVSDLDGSNTGDDSTLIGIEAVTGTAGNDSFTGGDASHAPDVLGNEVVESFQPGAGDDTVTGATGNGVATRVDYATVGTAVTIDLGAGTATGADIGSDTLVRIDQVHGGTGNDTLNGGGEERSACGTLFERFRGNAGNDVINGAGSDTVVGAAGTDAVDYANSTSGVVVNLDTAAHVIKGDTVAGGAARDGFGGTDTLIDIDQVQGSNRKDTLIGGADGQRLIGGGGNDSLVGAAAGVEASYQTALSAVTASLASGTASDGQGGNDVLVGITDLRGGDFHDTLTGDARDNFISGGAGDDTIDGGGGIDFAGYSAVPLANSGIDAFIENGSGTVNDGYGTTDTLTNIEGLNGTHSDDTLAGGAGDQWFIGRGGSDSIVGGAGKDWASYILDPAGVTVNLGTGSATDGWGGVWALGGTDTLVSIENVEGSDFADTLTGHGVNNVLRGNQGDDTIDGGGGIMDLADYSTATGSVTVNLTTNTSSGADGADTLSNIEGVQGSAFNDTLSGANGVDNALYGLGGNDSLNGRTGDDSMIGGRGNDTYVVDSALDVVTEAPSEGNADLIKSSVSIAALAAQVEMLRLTGSAANATGNGLANTITGNAAANTLDGSGGDDALLGQGGNDVLRGGTGRDALTGSAGLDMYDFNTALNAPTNVDTITAYSPADDLIRLDNDIFTGLATGTLGSQYYYEAGGATQGNDANDRIVYNTNNGKVYFDADGSGSEASVLFAVLTGVPNINAADFLIVN
jgi:Ca2+-binding RTX toxin-like protein